jgi:hypothetical protein
MSRDFTSKKYGYSSTSYTDILEERLLPQYRPVDIVVQDNAPINNSRHSKEWLERYGIYTLEWPPTSTLASSTLSSRRWASLRRIRRL